jgi:hypothetical protein
MVVGTWILNAYSNMQAGSCHGRGAEPRSLLERAAPVVNGRSAMKMRGMNGRWA